jgi:hypothetical protein
MLRKQITKRVQGAEKTKKVSKRATVMQARKPTVDLLLNLRKGVSVKPLQATARRCAVCGA